MALRVAVCCLILRLPPFIQPHFWSLKFWLDDALNEPAVWLFVGGILSGLVTLYLAKPHVAFADRRTRTAERDC